MFDTVKGGDYPGGPRRRRDPLREAVDTVIELEHLGLPFNRTADGRIDQRFLAPPGPRQGPVRRACYAADPPAT